MDESSRAYEIAKKSESEELSTWEVADMIMSAKGGTTLSESVKEDLKKEGLSNKEVTKAVKNIESAVASQDPDGLNDVEMGIYEKITSEEGYESEKAAEQVATSGKQVKDTEAKKRQLNERIKNIIADTVKVDEANGVDSKDVGKLTKTKDGYTFKNKATGKEQKVKGSSFKSTEMAQIVSFASKYESEAIANQFMLNFDESKSSAYEYERIATTLAEGYRYGNTLSEVMDEHPYVSKLSMDTLSNLYNMAEKISKEVAAVKTSDENVKPIKKLAEATGITVQIGGSKKTDGSRLSYKGTNAFYDPSTNAIYINPESDNPLTVDFVHEFVHYAKANSDVAYGELKDFLDNTFKDNNESFNEEYERLNTLIRADYAEEIAALDESEVDDYVDEEIIAHMTESVMEHIAGMSDKEMDTLVKSLSKNKTLLEKIRDFIKGFLSKVKSQLSGYMASASGNALISQDEYDQLKLFESKLINAINTVSSENEASNTKGMLINKKAELAEKETGIGIDADSGTGVMNSTRTTLAQTWKKLGYESYESAVDSVAEDIAEKIGVSKEKAVDWIKAEESLSSIILRKENEKYLNYLPDDRYKAIKKNSDYPQGTADMSNLCRKREIFTKMFDELQRENPNVLFTAEDIAIIRQTLADSEYEVACALCYVEDRRQKMGEIADAFIGFYKEALESKTKKIYKRNYQGTRRALVASKAQIERYELTARKGDKKVNFYADDEYIPTQYDLTTYEGFKNLTNDHPVIAYAFENYNNSRGMASARLIEGHAEYDREILSWSDRKVKSVNNKGGLRVFSFSDFEAIHLIDIVQILMDCSARGVKVQAYTKVPAFAKLIRETGVKLNRSLIPATAKSENAYALIDGKFEKVKSDDRGMAEVNGKEYLAFDSVEGIDVTNEDFVIDESANHDIGNILIGINDEQIKKAMTDDYIDYIIPFHSGQSANVLHTKGISSWDNYKDSQEDKKLKGNKTTKKGINIYTDVLEKYDVKNKHDFVDFFLKECKRQKFKPRFAQFLNVDEKGEYSYREGYHKFLVDYKLFDSKGNILPQNNITPKFELDFMNAILMQDKVRSMNLKFSDEIKAEVHKRLADKGKELDIKKSKKAAVDSLGRSLSEGQQEFFAESKIRDAEGNLKVMYHGTDSDFTVFDTRNFGGKNGIAEGYGIYFADTKEITSYYGDKTLEVYLNVTRPASASDKTITRAELKKLIKATCEEEAKTLIEEGYDSLDDALKDTWISNYVDTYSSPSIESSYKEVTDSIYSMNYSDMDIVQEVMAGQGIRSYDSAMDFYEILTDVTGIDGYTTEWQDPEDDNKTYPIVVAFNSNQVKLVSNENPSSDLDIRFAKKKRGYSYSNANKGINAEKIIEEGLKLLGDDTAVKDKDVRDIADKLLKITDSSYSRDDLAFNLNALFSYIGKKRTANFSDLMRIAHEIAVPVIKLSNADTKESSSQRTFNLALRIYQEYFTKKGKDSVVNKLEDATKKVKERYETKIANAKTRREESELRKKIRTKKAMLDQMLTHPTKGSHIPVKLVRSIVEVVDAINVESDRMTYKAKEEARKLEKAYEDLRNDEIYGYAYDEQIARYIRDLTTIFGEKNVGELKKDDLEKVYTILNAIEYQIRTENRMLSEESLDTLYEKKEKAIKELNAVKGYNDKSFGSRFANAYNSQVLDLERLLNKSFGYKADSEGVWMADTLKKGELTMYSDLREFEDIFSDVVGGTDKSQMKSNRKNVLDLQGKKAKLGKGVSDESTWVELPAYRGGQKVRVPKSMRLSLIMHLYNEDNIRHIAYGGFRVPNVNDYMRGDIQNAYARGTLYKIPFINEEDIKAAKEKIESFETWNDDVSDESIKGRWVVNSDNELYKAYKKAAEELDALRMSDFDEQFEDDIATLTAERNAAKSKTDRDAIQKQINALRDAKREAYARKREELYKAKTKAWDEWQQGREEAYKALDREAGKKALEFRKVLESELDEYEKAFLDAAKEFFWNATGKKINETSMKLYNYQKANVKHYFPQAVDSAFITSEDQSMKFDKTLEGMGILKERVPSKRPILLEDMTSVIQRQMSQVAKYHGFALAVRDVKSLLNNGKDNTSVRDVFAHKWGYSSKKTGILNMVDQSIADIESSRNDSSIYNQWFNKIRGNFAQATLMGNLGVTVKQAASYPTAAAELDWGSLAKALSGYAKKPIEEIESRTPLMNIRRKGLSTQELGEIADSTEYGDYMKWFTGMISAMDVRTVQALEYASMYHIDKTRSDLVKGTDEYWDAVTDKFNDVIRKTQPNYTTLERPEVLKNPNAMIRTLFMFKTQPVQNYGILYDAIGEYKAKSSQYKEDATAENLELKKAAGKKLARAISSNLVAQTVFSLMSIAAKFLYHNFKALKDDDDKDKDKISGKLVVKQLIEGILSSEAGMFIGGTELYELLQSKITGDTYYGMSDSLVEIFNDVTGAVDEFQKAAEKLAEASTTSEKEKAKINLLYRSRLLASEMAEAFGIPANNIFKPINSIASYVEDFATGKPFSSDGILSGNTSDVETEAEMMVDALLSGDKDEYKRLLSELVTKQAEDAREEDDESTDEDLKADATKYATAKIESELKKRLLDGQLSDDKVLDILEKNLKYEPEDAIDKVSTWYKAQALDGLRRYYTTEEFISAINGSKASEKVKASTIKTELRKEYLDDVINSTKLLDYLSKEGYSKEEANNLLDTWAIKKATDSLGKEYTLKEYINAIDKSDASEDKKSKKTETAIKNAYLSDEINYSDLVSYLEGLGYSQEDALKKADSMAIKDATEELGSEYTVDEYINAVRNSDASEDVENKKIAKAVKDAIESGELNESKAESYLSSNGYTKDEAYFIVQTAKYDSKYGQLKQVVSEASSTGRIDASKMKNIVAEYKAHGVDFKPSQLGLKDMYGEDYCVNKKNRANIYATLLNLYNVTYNVSEAAAKKKLNKTLSGWYKSYGQ